MKKITDNKHFDEVYDIRLACVDDIPMIMNFIDSHWRKGHIMGTNRGLFEYEFVHGNEVDMVIAIHKKRGTLEGIFGFLRCTEKRTGDIWGSLWKVNEESENMKLLGIELAKRVYSLTGCRSHIGNGANPNTTIPLRKIFFREKTVKMKQYYFLNPNLKNYKIASINEFWIPTKGEGTPSYTLKEISTFDMFKSEFDMNSLKDIPHKDAWYINHRFFSHPVYKYIAYGIYDKNKCEAVFFGRKIVVDNSSIFRIVDFIGEHKMIRGIFDGISTLIKRERFEYIDFYEFGVEDEYLEAAGFKNRDNHNNIIPNFFEPFVRENVDIWAHYIEDGTTFFKADGDQDRPNYIAD